MHTRLALLIWAALLYTVAVVPFLMAKPPAEVLHSMESWLGPLAVDGEIEPGEFALRPEAWCGSTRRASFVMAVSRQAVSPYSAGWADRYVYMLHGSYSFGTRGRPASVNADCQAQGCFQSIPVAPSLWS